MTMILRVVVILVSFVYPTKKWSDMTRGEQEVLFRSLVARSRSEQELDRRLAKYGCLCEVAYDFLGDDFENSAGLPVSSGGEPVNYMIV